MASLTNTNDQWAKAADLQMADKAWLGKCSGLISAKNQASWMDSQGTTADVIPVQRVAHQFSSGAWTVAMRNAADETIESDEERQFDADFGHAMGFDDGQ